MCLIFRRRASKTPSFSEEAEQALIGLQTLTFAPEKHLGTEELWAAKPRVQAAGPKSPNSFAVHA